MTFNNIEILIPTYKEAENLPNTIYLLKKNGFSNITILDANSKDGTEEIAKKNNCKILVDEKIRMGFGHSLINGINQLDSEYFCIFDADGSFDPNSIEKMYDMLKFNNLDFVFGSRYLDNNKSDDDTLVTSFGNFFFTRLINILFEFRTSDALFLFLFGKSSSLKKLNLKEKNFKICTEILIKANLNFKCKEIFSKEFKRIHGESKVNRVIDGFKILVNIIEMFIKQKKI